MTTYDTTREHITTAEAEKRSAEEGRSHLTRNYIATLLRKGKLEGFRPGRDWFVYADSLQRYLATERKPGPKGSRTLQTTRGLK